MKRNQQICIFIILAISTLASCQTTNEATVLDSKITSKYMRYRTQHINYVNSLEEKYLPIASVKKILDAAYATQENIENMIQEYYDQKIGYKSIVNVTPPLINETVKTLWEIAKAEEVNIINYDTESEENTTLYINYKVSNKDYYADDDIMPMLYVYEIIEMIEIDYSYVIDSVKDVKGYKPQGEDFYNNSKGGDYGYEDYKSFKLNQLQWGVLSQDERMWNWIISFGDVQRKWRK